MQGGCNGVPLTVMSTVVESAMTAPTPSQFLSLSQHTCIWAAADSLSKTEELAPQRPSTRKIGLVHISLELLNHSSRLSGRTDIS